MRKNRNVSRHNLLVGDASNDGGSAMKRGLGQSLVRKGFGGLLVCVLCLSADPASALRCGKRLVREGDSLGKVLRTCGVPESQTSWVEYHVLHGEAHSGDVSQDPVYIPVLIEEWVYDFGATRFVQQLHFEDHILRNIQPLGYGD